MYKVINKKRKSLLENNISLNRNKINSLNVTQRAVIRIRDLKERAKFFSENTIGDAAIVNAYTSPLFKGLKSNDRQREVVGIGQIKKLNENSSIIKEDENLIIVAHGSKPKGKTPKNEFGNRTPSKLAEKISEILPTNYRGCIYLNGCYTGARLNLTKEGTSYAEIFAQKLKDLNKTFAEIRGNIGSAITKKEEFSAEEIFLDKNAAKTLKEEGVKLEGPDEDGEYALELGSGIMRVFYDGRVDEPISKLIHQNRNQIEMYDRSKVIHQNKFK